MFQARHIGHGVGLRTKHYGQLLEQPVPVDWLEVISENFMIRGGRPLAVLEKVRGDVPVVLHGVSLSIGSVDPLNMSYLGELRALVKRIEPAWVSDHLCWGSHGGRYVHDLLPMPLTEEAVTHVAERVQKVQDFLGRQILVENVSSYIGFVDSSMTEWDFLSAIVEQADCGILLDINNIIVSAFNHGFDPDAYLAGIPASRVGQFHLAGHSDRGTYKLDTHDAAVPDGVWDLYRAALRRFGPTSTLVEWDDNIPPLDELAAQSARAAAIEAETRRPAVR